MNTYLRLVNCLLLAFILSYVISIDKIPYIEGKLIDFSAILTGIMATLYSMITSNVFGLVSDLMNIKDKVDYNSVKRKFELYLKEVFENFIATLVIFGMMFVLSLSKANIVYVLGIPISWFPCLKYFYLVFEMFILSLLVVILFDVVVSARGVFKAKFKILEKYLDK